jgi:tetratricopeptide (TPR) repeat protein
MKSIIAPLICIAGFAGHAFAQNHADLERCSVRNGPAAISPCSAIIDGGALKGEQLAAVLVIRGALYGGKGDLDRSLADLNAAVRAAPDYAGGYYNRGLTYVKKNDFVTALADFSSAIRLKPDYQQAFVNRGNIHLTQGHFQQAVADYSEAIRLNPTLSVSYANRSVAYEKLGDQQRAAADRAEAGRLRAGEAHIFEIPLNQRK